MSSFPPPPPPPPGGGWAPPPAGPPPAPPAGWGPAATGAPVWGWAPQPPLPGSGRFRAQAVGELLDSAFTLYRRNVRLILAITAVVQVPMALFSYLAYELTGYAGATTRLQQLSASGRITQQQLADLRSPLITIFAVAAAILLVQVLLVQPVATAAMTRAVADIYLEKSTSLALVYGAVGRRVGAVVGVSLLLLLAGLGIVVAVGVLLVAALLAAGQAGAAILIPLVPAAIFVAILVFTRWLFASPVVIIEQAGPVAAMRRSWHLVRGFTPRVFGITLLTGLITGILSAAIGALLTIVTQVGDDNVRLLLEQLASLIVSVVVQPITFIVVVLLYYDLRIRKEAFDIEMLAATL